MTDISEPIIKLLNLTPREIINLKAIKFIRWETKPKGYILTEDHRNNAQILECLDTKVSKEFSDDIGKYILLGIGELNHYLTDFTYPKVDHFYILYV